MGSRIITLQRHARELGRLRTGTFNGRYPQRSETWVITSHSRDYIEAAAEVWGGDVEDWQPQGNGAKQFRVITQARAIAAILPPGDPLTQAYESWSKGGCQRRCDGQVEQISDRPCLCIAQWGQEFHQSAPQDEACKMTTRLSVILPDLPDLGSWRVETHSYYSASELAATVDVLKGQLGAAAMVPVALRIEQRTRVAGGKTKQFPVVALELRGATAGQVMAGQVPTVSASSGQAPAMEPSSAPQIEAPARDWAAELDAATDVQAVFDLHRDARAAGSMTSYLDEQMRNRADELRQLASGRGVTPQDGRAPEIAPPDEPHAQDTDDGEETDALWMQCVAAWPGGTQDLIEAYARTNAGELPDDATVEQLRAFLGAVKAGKVAPSDEAEVSASEGVPF